MRNAKPKERKRQPNTVFFACLLGVSIYLLSGSGDDTIAAVTTATPPASATAAESVNMQVALASREAGRVVKLVGNHVNYGLRAAGDNFKTTFEGVRPQVEERAKVLMSELQSRSQQQLQKVFSQNYFSMFRQFPNL